MFDMYIRFVNISDRCNTYPNRCNKYTQRYNYSLLIISLTNNNILIIINLWCVHLSWRIPSLSAEYLHIKCSTIDPLILLLSIYYYICNFIETAHYYRYILLWRRWDWNARSNNGYICRSVQYRYIGHSANTTTRPHIICA